MKAMHLIPLLLLAAISSITLGKVNGQQVKAALKAEKVAKGIKSTVET